MGDGPEGRGSKIMRATRRASDSLSRIRRPGRGASPRSPLASAAGAAALLLSPAAADTLHGVARFAGPVDAPSGSVLEVVLEDLSSADASARRVGRTVVTSPGRSPFPFAVEYDPDTLEAGAIHALRATVRRYGEVLFVTDGITRVSFDDGVAPVELVLEAAGRKASGEAGALGLRLPATFRGTLPCADCAGIRHHLDLWPDRRYHMRREWLGEDAPLRSDEIGRWYADPARGAIVLYGASEMPRFWQVKGPERLRAMDMAGEPIVSELDYALTTDGGLTPTELDGLFLLGMMTHSADTASFADCLTGARRPIAREGDYAALEKAYLAARKSPGAPLLVHVEAGLARRAAAEGPDRMSLIVERFIQALPGETCPPVRPVGPL